MNTYHGTNGETLRAGHDCDGVAICTRCYGNHLSPAEARRLAADLLAAADTADAWMNAAIEGQL